MRTLTQTGLRFRKMFGILVLMCLLPVAAISQSDTIALEGFISSSKTLSGGNIYLLKHNVKISKGAVLTIEKGVKLIFEENTSLVVEGGLIVSGAPNEMVKMRSRFPKNPGLGILIRGSEGTNVSVSYAEFIGLSTPINFEMDWYRERISFTHCIFREMNTGESNILITSPLSTYQMTTDKKAEFIFDYNMFYNNWGGIYIEDLEDNVLSIQFNNNVITNNVVYGLDKQLASNTPIFATFDDEGRRYKTTFTNNSIYGNYQINGAVDTIIREITVGIQGRGESYPIPNNYFRYTDPKQVSATFTHFYQDNSLPLLVPDPILQLPPREPHAHIWKVEINNRNVLNSGEMPNVNDSLVTFNVYFNRPVTAYDVTQLQGILYDTAANSLKIEPIAIRNTSFSNGNMLYTFQTSKNQYYNNPLAYLVIRNFRDQEGFDVPEFTIGRASAINNYSKLYNTGRENKYIPPAEVINNPTGFLPDEEDLERLEELTELGDLSYLGAYTSLAKTWELGIFGGTSNYMGDLASQFMDKDQFRWSWGIWGQYNLSKWFSFRLAFMSGRVYGDDFGDDTESDKALRKSHFRSDIYEGALTAHFHLLQYGISKGEKFSPSIFAGVAFFHMSPEARIFTGVDPVTDQLTFLRDDDGKEIWIPLAALGTEGQTADVIDPEFSAREVPKQASPWQVSFPVGINLDFIINKSWIIGAEIGWRLTLTDYMDDISGYYFDRANAHAGIVNANPTIEDTKGRDITEISDQITIVGGVPYVTFENSFLQGEDRTASYPVAALLANPGIITAPYGTLENAGDPANSFNTAKRGDINRDWYVFAGIKVSKVFGYNKYQKKQQEKAIEEQIEL